MYSTRKNTANAALCGILIGVGSCTIGTTFNTAQRVKSLEWELEYRACSHELYMTRESKASMKRNKWDSSYIRPLEEKESRLMEDLDKLRTNEPAISEYKEVKNTAPEYFLAGFIGTMLVFASTAQSLPDEKEKTIE